MYANYYRYEIDFENAANESSGTYDSNMSFLRDVNDTEVKKRLKV